MKRSCAELAAEIASALMRGPRSARELCMVAGIDPGKAARTVRRYCDQFRASGCVRIVGQTPSGALIYGWQPAVFAEPDAVVAPQPKRHGGAHPRIMVEVNGAKVSLREASKVLGVRHGTLRQRVQRTGSVMLKGAR